MPLMYTTLGTNTLRPWKLYYKFVLSLNNKSRLQSYIKVHISFFDVHHSGYQHFKAVRTVLQDHSTCSLEQQVKIIH